MKLGTFFLSLSLATWLTLPAHAENYTIVIDGRAYPIDLDKTITANSKSGTKIEVTLKQNQYSLFAKDQVSYEYPSRLSVTSSQIEDGITQHLMVSAVGTLVLVQMYDDTKPSSLTELMMTELTDEDIAAGAVFEKAPHQRTLADGTVMTGLRGTLKAPKDEVTIEVLTLDVGQGGIIAITRHDTFTAPEEQEIIDRFWSTLKAK
jgi:hypothetical protein